MSGWRGLRSAALLVRRANWLARGNAAAARQLPAAEPVLAAVWQRVSWQRSPFTTSAAAASAPCERLPDKPEANELDGRLQEAGSQGADAVLELIEREGERFTELNVVRGLGQLARRAACACQLRWWLHSILSQPSASLQVTAMQAVADACTRSGASEQSVEAIVRSTPFQTLVGEAGGCRPPLMFDHPLQLERHAAAVARPPGAALQTWCWQA